MSSGQRQTNGDYQALVHLGKMVPVKVRWGRLGCVSSGQRKLMKAKEAKGDYKARVHLDRLVFSSHQSGGGGGRK